MKGMRVYFWYGMYIYLWSSFFTFATYDSIIKDKILKRIRKI